MLAVGLVRIGKAMVGAIMVGRTLNVYPTSTITSGMIVNVFANNVSLINTR